MGAEESAIGGSDEQDALSVSGAQLAPTDARAILEVIREDGRKQDIEYESNVRRGDYERKLQEALGLYEAKDEFQSGDVVQWKKYMRNRRFPHEGSPAIVVRTLAEPITHDSDGDLLADPKDVVLGYLDGDNDFVVGHYSSCRFTFWEDREVSP